MDEQSVRQQLAETSDRLKRVDEEREILLSLIHGFEGWLRLNSSNGEHRHAPSRTIAKVNNQKHGSISMRSAVRRVLEEAHGAPVHTKEIYRRVSDMGAITTGKRPEAVVDLTALSLSKLGEVEKAGPRMWRWAKNDAPIYFPRAAGTGDR